MASSHLDCVLQQGKEAKKKEEAEEERGGEEGKRFLATKAGRQALLVN